MPSPRRSTARHIARLLDAVSRPIWLVSDEQEIVFINEAAAEWLGVSANELIGRACRYQSADPDPVAAAADALCPPPEVFHGQKVDGFVAVELASGQIERRRAEFIPLPGQSDMAAGVLAMAGASAVEGDEPIESSADESHRLHEVVREFRNKLAQRHHIEHLAGASPAMRKVRAQVELAAVGRGAIHLFGPPGVGRQHVARTIHFAQTAPHGAIVPVSCTSLPVEVLRTTLAAIRSRYGRTNSEESATLLLTEVHRLPTELHDPLAQWLKAGTGNVRVMSTASEPLQALVDRGEYSPELAALLCTLVIELSPLSARRDDLPLIVQMLIEDHNAKGGKQLRGMSAEAIDQLAAYSWPGEMEELTSVLREAFASAEGYEIRSTDLPKRFRLAAEAALHPRKTSAPIDLEKFLAEVETQLIERALREAKGNKAQAARLLGLTRPKLYRHMVQLGLISGDDESSADATDSA